MERDAINRPDAAAMERLLEKAGHTTAGVILRLAWCQGLTREEIQQLTWADVALFEQQIHLPDLVVPLEEETCACLRARYRQMGERSPFVVVSDRLRRTLMKLSRSKSVAEKVKLVGSLRPGDLAPVAPSVNEPRTGMSMGEHQAITTRRWSITREAQDEVALASHQNLARAYDDGLFDDLITPFRGLTRDQSLRPDTSAEKLAKLAPVFGTSSPGATMTAGNSTPLSDGAAAVLLGTDEWAAERGLPVLAHVVDAEAAAVDFVHGAEGLLMGGAYAVPRLLARQGLGLEDFTFIEIHEAFASTVLTTVAAWADEEFMQTKVHLPALGELDRSKLNVAGSSLAAGHPFAATGARIVATLATLLRRAKDAEPDEPARGLISVCAAGGQAVAMILEAPAAAKDGDR